MRPFAGACAVAGSVACGDGDAQRHVYQSPPPRSAPATTTPAPTISAPPEPPIGTTGPMARIVSISASATGRPVSLQHVDERFTLLTLTTRGPRSTATGPMRLELQIVGPSDTVLAERLDTPVPVVIAHDFELDVGGGHGLRDGSYHAVLSLRDPSRRVVAASTPLYFVVATQ